jgi:hypothetical protein
MSEPLIVDIRDVVGDLGIKKSIPLIYKDTVVKLLYMDEIPKSTPQTWKDIYNEVIGADVYRIGRRPDEKGKIYTKDGLVNIVKDGKGFRERFAKALEVRNEEESELKKSAEEKIVSDTSLANANEFPVTIEEDLDVGTLYDEPVDTRTVKTALTSRSVASIMRDLPTYEDRIAFLKSVNSISKKSATKLMDEYRKSIVTDPTADKQTILDNLFNLSKLEREENELEERNIPYVLKSKTLKYNPVEFRKRGISNRF